MYRAHLGSFLIVAAQMLIFALVFFVWQRSVERRYSATPTFTPQV